MPPTDLASPTPWLRSQSESRRRRHRASRDRRRRLRGRTGAAALATAMTLLAGGAVAHERPAARATQSASHSTISAVERGDRGAAVKRVQRRVGVRVDGVFGRGTERAVKRFQRRKGLTPDGVVGPATAAALRMDLPARTTKRRTLRTTPGGATGVLDRIARCESGGNPQAVSQSGRYRGKYQFSRATWRAMGGTGDPARASEREQDRRAAKLLRLRGTSPWPKCA